MEGNQMRVMRVIAGNFSTNVNKVSKRKIHLYIYGLKSPRNHPHHPQTAKSQPTADWTPMLQRTIHPIRLHEVAGYNCAQGECHTKERPPNFGGSFLNSTTAGANDPEFLVVNGSSA